jgi:DNA-binding ferritin-like protein (Dps family)
MNASLTITISEIQSDILTIKNDVAIYEEVNFETRADAIDFIDFHIFDRIEGLQQTAEQREHLETLRQLAEKLKFELEEIDNNLFKQVRQNIASSKLPFKELINKYIRSHAINIKQAEKIGYDNLDAFVNGLLTYNEIPEPTLNRAPEMVFYQQTPMRIILELMELAQLSPDDVFFDIGSGLGQVGILVNLISQAITYGIEYEPAYCNYAKACASQLNLSNVNFINIDARKADYSQGTVFFMYTPFEGSMLDDMLLILKKESQKKSIHLFAYGPCSLQLTRHNWLTCVNGDGNSLYKLYEFKSLDN